MKISRILVWVFFVICSLSSISLFGAGLSTSVDEILTDSGANQVINMSEVTVEDDGFINDGYYCIDELYVLECYAAIYAEDYSDDFLTTYHVNEPYGNLVDARYAVKFYDGAGKEHFTTMIVESYHINNELFTHENSELPVKMQAYVQVGEDYQPAYQGKVSTYDLEKECLEKYITQGAEEEYMRDFNFVAANRSEYESEVEGFADVNYKSYYFAGVTFLVIAVLLLIKAIKNIKKRKEQNIG